MLIVQLNRNPNQEMMVSRINERKEKKNRTLGSPRCRGPLPRRGPMSRQSNPRRGVAKTGKFGTLGSPR